MTQEQKNLLLKDLCARLPYDVIVRETFQNVQRDVPMWDCGPYYIKGHPEKVKPYLRPMSSMTEEEKIEYDLFNTPTAHRKMWINKIDWLLSRHFDVRGLIPMGIALEAPEGMYK